MSQKKYFDIPDVNIPRMKLYYALHEIWLLYDKEKWNSDVKQWISVEMYCIKENINKPDAYERLQRFLKEIQVNPTVMPKGMKFNYRTMKFE